MRDDIPAFLADRWAVVAVACFIAGLILGWAIHVMWLRSRVQVTPTGDDSWAVTIARAVAGIYDTEALAKARADDIKKQIGGMRSVDP